MADKEHYKREGGAPDSPNEGVSISPEIEKIREKTFDREFQDLVSRVTAHRPGGRDLEKDAEQDLLRRFHRLFYRATGLFWVEEAYPPANHLDFELASLEDSLALHIYGEMDSLQLRNFAVLTYDFRKKSFACRLNHITQFNKDNLVMDIDEPLFRRIMKSRRGVYVDAASVERDPFLKKRFVQADRGVPRGVLFFLSLNFLEDDMFRGAGPVVPARPPVIPTVLMVLVEKAIEASSRNDLYARLKRKLSFAFMLYKNLLYPRISDYGTVTLAGAFGILEYYYTLYYRVLEGCSLFVRYSQHGNPETDYIFNYLVNRMIDRFPGRVAVAGIDKFSCFAFCRPGDFKELRRLVNDYNAETGGLFTCETWEHRQAFTFNSLLAEYLKSRM